MNSSTSPRKAYIKGYGLSLLLTLAAYVPVARHVNSHHAIYSDRSLLIAILILAIIQLVVQLVFFLHLGREDKPRWNLLVLGFAVLVVLIVVVGSLWIMSNLSYNMQTPQQLNQSVFDEENIPDNR